MSRKSWLQGLVERVSKSSRATPRKRPAFSPIKLEFLEDRTAPAALDWTGAAGTNWNTAGNWVQNAVPASNDTLNFDSATAGLTSFTSNNDITGLTGLTINITDADATAGKDFTITGVNAGVTSVSNNKTDGVTSATTVGLAMTGVGATLTATAGEVAIKNAANVFDAASSLNVPTGGIADIAISPNGSVGNAQINVTGGTLSLGLQAAPVPVTGILASQARVGGGGAGNALTVVPDPTLGTELQPFPMMSDISRSVPGGDTQFLTNTRTWGNNDTFLYSGQIFFPNSNGDGTGTLSFAEQNDDDTFIRIDGVTYLNVTDWNVTSVTGAITLPTGWHDLDLRFGNGGGGAGPSGQNGQGWDVGTGNTTTPDGKGFGYRVDSGPGTADPLASSVQATDYKRLWADASNPEHAGDGVALRVTPPRPNGTAANNVSVSGSSTIVMDSFLANATLGNLTMASGAALAVNANGTQTLTFGTTSLGGNATLNVGAGATLNLSGVVSETAASGITKSGTGILNLPAANTYSGLTTINAGTVNAPNAASLGAATGAADGTTVAAGAQLNLNGAVTYSAENLFLNGTGTTATNGAITSGVNATVPGPLVLQSDSLIVATANTLVFSGGTSMGTFKMSGAGAGSIQFGTNISTGPVTGSGDMVYSGTGTWRLTAANPGFTGNIIANSGIIRAGEDGSLGDTVGKTTINSGASLRFVGGRTYNIAEPVFAIGGGAGGIGAIVDTDSTNATVNSVPITLTGSTTFGASTAGAKLTINSTISMPAIATLTFVGAGNIDITSSFGNGTVATPPTPNALLAQYIYDTSANRTGSDMDALSLLAPGTQWVGTALLTTALSIGNSADPATPTNPKANASSFTSLFGGTSLPIANFVVYWTGTMTVTNAGNYIFGTGNVGNLTGLDAPDAQGRVWVDLDRNHTFDPATENVFNASATGVSNPIALTAGTYDIAIPFTNGGGAGGINISYSVDGGTTFQILNPGTPADGLSFTAPGVVPLNSVIQNGTGTVTLSGANTYNGTTLINSGTLVDANNSGLGTGSAGITVVSGGTLALTGGIALSGKNITADGTGASGQPGAIANISGANSYTGDIAAAVSSAGSLGIGSTAGDLTVNGTINLQYSKLVVSGAGNVVINSNISGVGVTIPSPGLDETIFNDSAGDPQNNIEEFRTRALTASDAHGTLTTQLNYADDGRAGSDSIAARASALGAVGFNADTWGGLWIQQFKPTVSGVWSFRAFAIDDNVGFWIDTDQNGTFETANRFGNRGCCGDTGDYNTPALVAGQTYLLGIALTDTGGGGFIITTQVRAPGGAYTAFNVATVSDNSLVKSGAGALTLNGANTYNGNTTITGGTVNYTSATAYGSPAATSTLTVSGATTVVNLFDNASAVTPVGTADFRIGQGTVNTGALGGKLATNLLKLANGYTVTGNMTAQGANLVDNSAPRTLSAVTGTLDVAKVDTSAISMPDNGQLFVNGTSQNNTFSYSADFNATVLVVSIATRSNTAPGIAVSTITYDGVPMVAAVQAPATASSYHSVFIYYLYFPTTGLAAPLVVNFSTPIQDSFSVYAETLTGVDTSAIPVVGKSAVTEVSALTQTATVNGIIAGSVAITDFNYRTGTGPVSMSTTNGTAQTGGTVSGGTAGTGDFWYAALTNQIDVGGFFTNLNAGSATFTATAAANSGGHFNGAAAVFAPVLSPGTVNLPATNFSLAAGTSLSINGSGDSVIGNVTYAGDASIVAGANAPTSLTVGSISGPGTGKLSINNDLGLKLATGSSYSVDLNGATAGTQYDQAVVTGPVNLNGATLNVTTGFTPTSGDTFTIVNNDLADPVVGTFAGLPQGSTVTAGGNSFSISYTGGDGNDVVLTALAAGVATTTTLVANPLATTGGMSVMFTATVAPSPGSLGTVTFLDNGVAIPGGSNVALSGDQAVFSTTTLSVGSHPVTAAYSGAAGFAASTSNTQTVVITSGSTPPTVVSVTPNAGLAAFSGAQRSRVVNQTVVFDQAVQLDPDAMTLALHTNNVSFNGVPQPTGMGTVPTTLTLSSTDNITWTITFSGAGTVETGTDGFSSLKDGVYDLNIDATKVHPNGAPGVNMAANSTTTFHRLFGDTNAPATPAGGTPDVDFQAIVNSVDNLQFRGAFNNPVTYKAYLDFNGDGTINSGDNLQFRNRFNKALVWRV